MDSEFYKTSIVISLLVSYNTASAEKLNPSMTIIDSKAHVSCIQISVIYSTRPSRYHMRQMDENP